jgi:hypothetical protein
MEISFKKIINSNQFFTLALIVFVLSLAVAVYYREGKDLKVDLFGVEQILQGHSPYENPLDPNRAIFRYAPGFTLLAYPFLLTSRMIAPFQFGNILFSIFAWYLAEIFSLVISVIILFKLIPSPAKEISIRNLKISLLMASPLIGYELANGQNKLFALCFMLTAIFLFEKNRLFASAVFYSLALTVYIALLPFLFYFLLRKKEFIFSFTISVLIVFFIFPSVIFGIGFNAFLLKEWFLHALKPFFLTNSYTTYIDLRISSQALPSAIGRMFVSGRRGHFNYFISPLFIHVMIRAFSAMILSFSLLAAWKRPKAISRGLDYVIFLILALILPQYCIFYTWSWAFVFYFVAFNYMSSAEATIAEKRILLIAVLILFSASSLIGIPLVNYYSFLFWATFVAWLGIVIISIRPAYERVKPKIPWIASN